MTLKVSIANSADPGQTAPKELFDLGLHCLLRHICPNVLGKNNSFIFYRHEHHDHLTTLTKQLLGEENLPSGWADIIISTVDRVSLFVKPDVKNSSDDMDIRQYVHIKKVGLTGC